ncbi:hypothetical protein L2E82_32693 [Cichorium intybus]|uniref:Uncharacterized protein n=1 Tax=Cichorium intybus TaxID=13427 RepID=A0ACB9BIH3_CICIN|nr:hypothetical protein L2E82_32693 [Cichorium intybus]
MKSTSYHNVVTNPHVINLMYVLNCSSLIKRNSFSIRADQPSISSPDSLTFEFLQQRVKSNSILVPSARVIKVILTLTPLPPLLPKIHYWVKSLVNTLTSKLRLALLVQPNMLPSYGILMVSNSLFV